MTLADRVFTCGYGHSVDQRQQRRDESGPLGPAPPRYHSIPGPPSNGAGPPMSADGTALTNTPVLVKPARKTREPTFTPHPRPEPTTPEKGGAEHSPELFDTL